MPAPRENGAPLIVHIVFRLDYGGLENGVVNLVNALSGDSFRHIVIALTEVTDFADRLSDDVPAFSLGKKPGKDPVTYFRLYKLLRRLRPTVVHTRNIGTLDCSFIAFLARVPVRIHGEHGWDVFDPDGNNRKYKWIRRIFAGFVHRFITVSNDLREWLVNVVGISAGKITHICNGVDTDRFQPGHLAKRDGLPAWLDDENAVVIGTVSRFSAIKDPMNLVNAFVRVCRQSASLDAKTRLVMIGDGELHDTAVAKLKAEGLFDVAWLPGSRDDVADLLREMDVFVLASYREGISNTILEAMASGLPVIATDTGGNRELVASGTTGELVPPANSDALADSLVRYVVCKDVRETHGEASRRRAVENFSIGTMVKNYGRLYASELAARGI